MDDQIKDEPNAAGPKGPYQPVVPDSVDPDVIAKSAADEPDDSLLQSAAKNMSDDEVGVPPPSDFKPKSGKGKKIFFFLFLLALIAGGAAAYYFLVYKKPAPAPIIETPTEAPAANTFTPENVAYAFREKASDPYGIYLRPVGGGERVEVGELSKQYYPNTDIYGQNIVILSDNKLLMSTDGGKTYSQILETEAGQDITSVAFNTDGTKLGVAILDTEKSQNTVSSMGLDGQNAVEIFTSKDHQGISLMGWDDQNVIFDTFTPNSDGNTPNPYHYSVETKKSTRIIKPVSGTQTIHADVSDDLTKLVYVAAKATLNADDPLALPLAPHTVSIVDIASAETKTIATVGKAGEQANNGTPLQRDTLVGFMVNSTTPYYTDRGKLFTVSGEEPVLSYEADKTIVSVSFVSEKSVIASSGTYEDFVLTNFDVATEATTTILEGDAQTVIFGVTTK